MFIQLQRRKIPHSFGWNEPDFKRSGFIICHKSFTENHTVGRGEEMTEKYCQEIRSKFMSHKLLAERNIKIKIVFLPLT